MKRPAERLSAPATPTNPKASIYPLITPRERISIWEKARGMWKRRKPDPTQELKKMRKEWDRKLPHTDE